MSQDGKRRGHIINVQIVANLFSGCGGESFLRRQGANDGRNHSPFVFAGTIEIEQACPYELHIKLLRELGPNESKGQLGGAVNGVRPRRAIDSKETVTEVVFRATPDEHRRFATGSSHFF
jgi:hypothetical protein